MSEDPLDHKGEYHTFHSDPNDDMTFKSSGNMLAKASSWTLSKASLAVEPCRRPQTQRNAKSIDIHGSAKVHEVFPDMVHVTNSLQLLTDLPDTYNLLKLCRQFDCERMEKDVHLRLRSLATTAPWKVMDLASTRVDVEFARVGIRYLTLTAALRQLWNNISGLRWHWQSPFLRCMLGNPDCINHTGRPKLLFDQYFVAAALTFEPPPLDQVTTRGSLLGTAVAE